MNIERDVSVLSIQLGPRAIRERSKTFGRVVTADKGVGRERINTGGSVVAPVKVPGERTNTGGGVVIPLVVASECEKTGGGVVIAIYGALERSNAVNVASERKVTNGGVETSSRVIRKRPNTDRRVAGAGCVALERQNRQPC